MNARELIDILLRIIPPEAEEVVVKGRNHSEVFFSMPKGWKPSNELKGRISQAPNQPAYSSYKTMWRWRAS